MAYPNPTQISDAVTELNNAGAPATLSQMYAFAALEQYVPSTPTDQGWQSFVSVTGYLNDPPTQYYTYIMQQIIQRAMGNNVPIEGVLTREILWAYITTNGAYPPFELGTVIPWMAANGIWNSETHRLTGYVPPAGTGYIGASNENPQPTTNYLATQASQQNAAIASVTGSTSGSGLSTVPVVGGLSGGIQTLETDVEHIWQQHQTLIIGGVALYVAWRMGIFHALLGRRR